MKQFKKPILLSLFLLCCNLISYAQENANFTYIPEKPENGKPVEIHYNAKGTPLAGKKNVTAVVYEYKSYKWQAFDMNFTGDNDSWKGTLNVPENCGIIAVKFKSDTLVDNNKDQGYFLMFRDKDRQGVMAPGGYAGWGLARSPKLNLGIPGYMKFKGISDTASYYWLSQEIAFNQQSKATLVMPYAIAVKNYLKEDAGTKLGLVMRFLTRPDASEDELLKARSISGNLLSNKKTKDSIDKVLLDRFPKGSLARLTAFKTIGAQKEMADVIKASEQFLSDFPVTSNADFDAENRINYGTIYQNIILISQYLNKNTAAFDKYNALIPYQTLGNLYYKFVEIPFNRKDQTPQTLYPIAEQLMKRYDYFLANKPEEYSYLTASEWKDEVNRSRAGHVFPVHISLLMTAGKKEEAMKYAVLAQSYLDYKNTTINSQYAMLLQQDKDTKALTVVLTKALYKNQSTPEMIEMLKGIYIKEHKSEKGFAEYVESLKNPADIAAAKKEAIASMMNKPMPEWSMKDMSDKVVNSKDLIGKTVILDFWATWCVPCKASFPGMKLAVEKYKNDPNVLFYFVDTEERGADYKSEVKKYIKDNNYPFNVLFDNKAEGAKATGEVFDRIAKTFTISGIPQKLFVDKKGNLRFISVGFNGSATALADDIENMVELTKNAK